MGTQVVETPFQLFTDANGLPLEGGYIYIGTVGLNPEINPVSVYWDFALTIPAAQPIRTLNGYPARNGSASTVFVNSEYSIEVKDKNQALVFSHPNSADTNPEGFLANGTVPMTGGLNLARGADVIAANALVLGTDGNSFDITGTTTITSIGALGVGTFVTLQFDEVLTLTHHATDLILPRGSDIVTSAGDTFTFTEYASGDWLLVSSNAVSRKGADVASATVLPIINDGDFFDVTGTTTVTSIASIGIGKEITLQFDGVLTLTHDATNLVLPNGADIVTKAGDIYTFYEYATGDWRLASSNIEGTKGSDVASASSLPVINDGDFFDVTGTTTVTSIVSIGVGKKITLQFDGVLTVAHHATNLILPEGSDILVKDGDVLTFREYAPGDWLLVSSNMVPRKGSDVASATALPVINDGDFFDVTGTTTVTSIASIGVGKEITLQFDGVLTLTHHATNLILPGGANILTAAGDVFTFKEYASGDWILVGQGVAISATTVIANDTTNSTSPTTGAIHTNGGLGVVKDTKLGGTLAVTGETTVTADVGIGRTATARLDVYELNDDVRILIETDKQDGTAALLVRNDAAFFFAGIDTDDNYKIGESGPSNNEFVIAGGDVGLGRVPTQELDIYRLNDDVRLLLETDKFNGSSAILVRNDTDFWFIGIDTDNTFAIGHSGAGTGDFVIATNGVISMSAYGEGTATFSAAGVISSDSDKNMKTNIVPLSDGIDKVLALKPVYFNWIDTDLYGAKDQLGFLAQDVNEVCAATGTVSYRKKYKCSTKKCDTDTITLRDGKSTICSECRENMTLVPNSTQELWGVYDRGLIAMCVKAIQEQQETFNVIETRLAALEV